MSEYTHTTLAELRAALAGRLGDPANIHWLASELDLNIGDALSRWGLLTGMYRIRGEFSTTNNIALYDLATQTNLLPYLSRARTDRDELGIMQHMLREPYDPIDGTGMSDQFTFDQLVSALQRARDQFRADTLTPLSTLSLVVTPDSDLPALPDNVISIRRAIWLSIDGARSNVHLADEHEALAYNITYSLDSGTPELYSLVGSPQLSIRLIPPPADSGTLELIVATTGPQLDPSVPTALDIADDCAWIVRSLALSDLLARDGPAYDPSRAEYLRAEYQLGVQLATQCVVLLNAELDGAPVLPSSLADIDFAYSSPHWQSAATGSPTDLGVLSTNLVALRPVPDSNSHSVLVDVVRKSPQPTADTDFIQVPREDLSAILDGAESLCLFKLGGESAGDMRKLSESMFRAAMRYNSRLSIDGYAHTMSRSAMLESDVRATEGVGRGVGTVPGRPSNTSTANS